MNKSNKKIIEILEIPLFFVGLGILIVAGFWILFLLIKFPILMVSFLIISPIISVILLIRKKMNVNATFYYFMPTIMAIVMCGYCTLGGYGRPESYITSVLVKGDVVTQEEIDTEGESQDVYSFKPYYAKDASVEETVTYSLYFLIILSFSINMMILGAVQKKNRIE